jgi:RND superfamily putative drug exporter
MERPNLAGRAGRWSAAHWKLALFGWLVLAAAAMAIGNVAGHVQMADSQFASGGAAKAIRLLEQGRARPRVQRSSWLRSSGSSER